MVGNVCIIAANGPTHVSVENIRSGSDPVSSLVSLGPLMDYLPTWQRIYFYNWG